MCAWFFSHSHEGKKIATNLVVDFFLYIAVQCASISVANTYIFWLIGVTITTFDSVFCCAFYNFKNFDWYNMQTLILMLRETRLNSKLGAKTLSAPGNANLNKQYCFFVRCFVVFLSLSFFLTPISLSVCFLFSFLCLVLLLWRQQPLSVFFSTFRDFVSWMRICVCVYKYSFFPSSTIIIYRIELYRAHHPIAHQNWVPPNQSHVTHPAQT